MSSVGPQLPPHLSKRKRTPEDESADSPAAKLRATEGAQTNQDEIDLDSDDDDDDGYGPPAPQPAAKTSIGPTLPPSNTDEIKLDDSDDDDTGPSAPPPPTNTRPSIGPTLPPANKDEIQLEDKNNSFDDEAAPAPPPAPPSAKRVHGPAPPPAPLSERPTTSANSDSDSDSDDDDDYGPALPTSISHIQRQTQARAAEEAARAAEAAAGPQRDDWMLAPPTASGYRAPDPTKLKNRRFASGPRAASSAAAPGSEISSIWTETPEQKRKRLENAVLGRSDDTTQARTTSSSGAARGAGSTAAADAPLSKEAQEQQDRVRSYTEATRGRSLYEEHQSSRQGRKLQADEEEDDPSKRAFDREKDMKLGGRIGTAQRRELLNRAADFGGRFAKGKYL
ncbi:uncharacterized protein F4817DRAFT_299862 [Daldinia loculata]|uniref:uncharacterized protein n=1 Tax=Daldinia loculata TaxID=103429 RepID=UPI0020C267D9|nr:uncharacterized protein F4817DRAFT_299862 [Daldinia loculata]KAI1649942.1 hypothetical protein F4817DRAFT_299862 [Daldinia loculata]